ncbi:hypothetical protein MYK68_15825 [Gordonia sp. PP30]|uniref:hypothetical protein n=1 Tax=Gordonia sp. PP30 TaxID=2935861 RepID=UPI001FFF3221|nr:hypothetical protein [Gordonia sp. PP30]UQE74181.1 hypothetical protein MYK68_15825 [Gordonia sp. PP30]
MANTDWTNAERRAGCAALTALRNIIGLRTSTGALVKSGTTPVSGTTTWSTPADYVDSGITWARSVGSTVPLVIPAGAVAAGTIITEYAFLDSAGTSGTAVRWRALPVSLTINDAGQSIPLDVTPELWFRGD